MKNKAFVRPKHPTDRKIHPVDRHFHGMFPSVGPIFAPKSPPAALKRPPAAVAIFWKIKAIAHGAASLSAPSIPGPQPAASCGRSRLPARGRAGSIAHPETHPPPRPTESTLFSAKNAPHFAIYALRNRTKKQFLLQNQTFWPRKGRKISFLATRCNSFCLHLQMKHHGAKAKQTRFTQPRRNLTSNRHRE